MPRRDRKKSSCNRGRHVCRRFQRARTPHCLCVVLDEDDLYAGERVCCGCGMLESSIDPDEATRRNGGQPPRSLEVDD